MFKNIDLENAIVFYTGGVYRSGGTYNQKIKDFLKEKKSKWYTVEWVYFITNELEDARKNTSSSFIQRLQWITTDKVWDNFIEFRNKQSKIIPISLKSGKASIDICSNIYTNPDIDNMAIPKLLIWDTKLCKKQQYSYKNLIALIAIAIGNREYSPLIYVRSYITEALPSLFM